MRSTTDDPSRSPGDMMDGVPGSGMMDGGQDTGWMVAFAVLALVLLALALVAVLTNLVLHVRRPAGRAPDGEADATLLLDRRLARGEVSAEEYRTVRGLLERT